MIDINVELLQRFKHFFEKWPVTDKQTRINPDVVSDNQQLGKELHKLIWTTFT